MIRTQISLDKNEYNLAKMEAAALGISLAEFIRRAVRELLPVPFVTTGDAHSSQSIDELVHGTKD